MSLVPAKFSQHHCLVSICNRIQCQIILAYRSTMPDLHLYEGVTLVSLIERVVWLSILGKFLLKMTADKLRLRQMPKN